MTITNVYIGKLSEGPDPLDWGGNYRRTNVPPRLGAFFPPARRDPFFTLLGKIREGHLDGKQVDWGASAANVSRQQIVEFIEEIYRGDETFLDPTSAPHLFPKLGELTRFVATLADERYALVAIEV